ncbi:MAG: hypothetical protein LR015_04650 [Verrucomicrobia bacterium]|nr:hypothetical protein [Verrucomicrobiota bacterium]
MQDVDQLLEELQVENLLLPGNITEQQEAALELDTESEQIGQFLCEEGPLFLDQLVERLAVPVYQVAATLMRLEIQRLVRKSVDGRYEWLA